MGNPEQPPRQLQCPCGECGLGRGSPRATPPPLLLLAAVPIASSFQLGFLRVELAPFSFPALFLPQGVCFPHFPPWRGFPRASRSAGSFPLALEEGASAPVVEPGSCFALLAQNHGDSVFRARTWGLLVPGSWICSWTVGKSPSPSIPEIPVLLQWDLEQAGLGNSSLSAARGGIL